MRGPEFPGFLAALCSDSPGPGFFRMFKFFEDFMLSSILCLFLAVVPILVLVFVLVLTVCLLLVLVLIIFFVLV